MNKILIVVLAVLTSFVPAETPRAVVDRIEGEMRIKAKIRYRQEEQWAIVTQPEEDVIQVVFDEPQRAVAPGQSVVFYKDGITLGGGIISKAIKA